MGATAEVWWHGTEATSHLPTPRNRDSCLTHTDTRTSAPPEADPGEMVRWLSGRGRTTQPPPRHTLGSSCSVSDAQISEAVQHPCQEPRSIPAHAPALTKGQGPHSARTAHSGGPMFPRPTGQAPLLSTLTHSQWPSDNMPPPGRTGA